MNHFFKYKRLCLKTYPIGRCLGIYHAHSILFGDDITNYGSWIESLLE